MRPHYPGGDCSEGDRDYTGLVERLQQLQGGNGTAMCAVRTRRAPYGRITVWWSGD
ncbi:MAG: hypothetical protein GDA43_11770 [Hormoscilla sp. SP5CHS1]|nr:hypothetical protein [Hormoscilla sp. SP12CHS1]MBC6453799.1 hypothetical protein [Hormoscilla sp. SP5CHS1]